MEKDSVGLEEIAGKEIVWKDGLNRVLKASKPPSLT